MPDIFAKMVASVAANAWLIVSIILGIGLSIISSDHLTWRVAVARVAAGLFCGTFLPGPTLDFIGRDPAVWGNTLAGLYAMTGYALVRMIATLNRDEIAAWVKLLRGGK